MHSQHCCVKYIQSTTHESSLARATGFFFESESIPFLSIFGRGSGAGRSVCATGTAFSIISGSAVSLFNSFVVTGPMGEGVVGEIVPGRASSGTS